MVKLFDARAKTKFSLEESSKNDTIELIKHVTSSLETIRLSKQEYAHVMSEINTHLSDEQREQSIVSKAIGDYIYTFENNEFDNYRIVGKVPIDSGYNNSIGDILDE